MGTKWSGATTVSAAANDFVGIFRTGQAAGSKFRVNLSDLIPSVTKVGTPAANQVAVWTGDGTLQGEPGLSFSGGDLRIVAGDLILPSAGVIKEEDGDILLLFSPAVGSAVNYLEIKNALTGLAPGLYAAGETNVNLALVPKGTGSIQMIGPQDWQGDVEADGATLNDVVITGATLTAGGSNISASLLTSGTLPIARIGNGTVTLAKLANISNDRILGRVSGGSGVIEELTAAQILTLINVEAGADVTDATNVAAAGAIMDSDYSANGVQTRTASGVYTVRSIAGTANEIDVANGDGASGNPTVGLADNPIIPGTAKVRVPVGTTAQRPGTPADGDVRVNSTTGNYEGYRGGSWRDLEGGGSGDNLGNHTATQDLDMGQNDIIDVQAIKLDGIADGGAPIAGQGHLFANTNSDLIYTDDGDADRNLTTGLFHISKTTLSSTSEVTFTGLGATPNEYVWKFINVIPATDTAILELEISTDNGATYKTGASDYGWCANGRSVAGIADAQDSADDSIRLTSNVGSSANEDGISGTLRVAGLANSSMHLFIFDTAYINNTAQAVRMAGCGQYLTSGAIDAIKIKFSSGNLESGEIHLFELREAA